MPPMATKVVPALLALFVAPVLGAQQFTSIGREAVPRTTGSGWTRLVDVDGDGALDMLCRTDLYFHNDGHARFTQRVLGGGTAGGPLYVVGDFDGDGDQDLLTTGAVLESRAPGPIWRGSNFTGSPLATGDFNADGKTDVVSPSGVAIATSLTTFQSINITPGNVSVATVADIDGDGDLDVVRVSPPQGQPPFTIPGSRSVARNDGGGTWATVFPFGGTSTTLAFSDIVAFDADGDGDVDCGFLGSTGWEFWRNQGGGTFTLWSGLPFGSGHYEVCDFDRDGDADLVTLWGWWENVGLGSFTAHLFPFLSVAPMNPSLQAIGDVDGDLDLDLVVGESTVFGIDAGRHLLLNRGGQDFVDATAWQWRSNGVGAVCGDVDGDGSPDLIDRGNSAILWRNGGDGWFAPTRGPYVRQLVDLDGDGDIEGLEGP